MKNKRKIRRDSEAQIRQQIILRRTEWLSRNVTSDKSKCGQRQIDFTKTFDSITHKSIWEVFKSWDIENDYISFQKKLYSDQKVSVLTDEESNIFEILCQAYFSTWIGRKLWKTTFRAEKKLEFTWVTMTMTDTRKEIEVDDIKSRNTDKRRKREILGSYDHVTSKGDDRNRISTVWTTFLKYRQELTSKNYILNYRLWLFDAVINWTIYCEIKEYERVIQ